MRTISGRLPSTPCPTVAWLQSHGVEFSTPTYYLSVGPPRIQPVGGGRAIVERLGAGGEGG